MRVYAPMRIKETDRDQSGRACVKKPLDKNSATAAMRAAKFASI